MLTRPSSESAPPKTDETKDSPTLTRIEHKLDGFEQRLKRIETQTAPKQQNPAHTGASKATVAATFALVGFKLGAFFLGKVGFLLFDHPRAYKRGGLKAVGELWSNMVTFGGGKKPEHLVGDYKYMAIGLATGSILGPIAAGWIGWVRGDRLEKPSDLFSHPFESLGKIFGPPPKKDVLPSDTSDETRTVEASSAKPRARVEATRQHTGTLTDTARERSHP